MIATADTRERFRFFLDHAGYCTPPGRAACALELARVDGLLGRALALGVATVEWVDDPSPLDHDDAGTLRGIESGELVGPAGCIVTVGLEFSSLWGVVVQAPSSSRGDDPYLRVVAAELASEMVDALRQAVGDAEDADAWSAYLDSSTLVAGAVV